MVDKVRRIVTAHDNGGKSTFLVDGEPTNVAAMTTIPDFGRAILWSTGSHPHVPARDDIAPTVSNLHPAVGETRCILLTIPPDTAMVREDLDHRRVGEEALAVFPGIFDRMEPDSPGMHQTDSIDYVMIAHGEIWLELDDGVAKQLKPGDIVIQNGTRHAWRNKSSKTATLFAVLVGAQRERGG